MAKSRFFSAFLASVAILAASKVVNAGVIEGFESGNLALYTSTGAVNATVSPTFAHDGNFGLGMQGTGSFGEGWIYRNDAGVQVQQGDTISVWIQFSGTADSRAYFGFGASGAGTLSLVLAPNTNQLIIQANNAFNFADIGLVGQTYQANKWYRGEVQWDIGGAITGRLYDSDGTTLLNTVNANSNLFTSGGIAFRGFGGVKAFDTVESSGASAAVPEPATLTMFGLGALGFGFAACRRRKLAR